MAWRDAARAAMSSSIYNDESSWKVSNMMFARVLGFAYQVGREFAESDCERRWVEELKGKIENFGTYSPNVGVDRLFPDPEQLEYWGVVLDELAQRIFKREIGNQSDDTWQVATICSAVDLSRFLRTSAHRMRLRGGPA
jgi:hypothetical protein